MKSHNLEVEIKLRLPGSLAQAKRLLRAVGFQVAKPRVFEANTLFDTPAARLRQASQLLRVRTVNRRGVLTFKGPPRGGKHKSREEIELEIPDPGQLQIVLSRLGFGAVFRYEKYRTEYQQPGRSGIITLDETPIGNFFELEGSPTWIDRTAKKLAFGDADYITASYGGLYLAHCQETGVDPSDMVFPRGVSQDRKD